MGATRYAFFSFLTGFFFLLLLSEMQSHGSHIIIKGIYMNANRNVSTDSDSEIATQ